MRRATFTTSFLALASVALLRCGSTDPEDFTDEGVGYVHQEASKCIGGKIGDSNYCTPTCKCDLGEGDCDNVNECNVHPMLGQLQCTGKTIYFGHPRNSNACAPLHCGNNKKDGNETVVDCGGDCGTVCPGACANLPPNGQSGHCTTDCRCTYGQGDCNNNNALCAVNFVCAANSGIHFGFPASTDLCIASHCVNMVQDGDEQGLNCGPSCLPCSGGSQLSFAKGGSLGDHGSDVAIDNSAAIVIAGRFGGNASFGGATFTAQGGADIYVARYNNAGTHGWSKRLGGAAADGDLGVAVAVDNGRNVYLAGNYRGTIDFGGGFTHTAVGLSDAFVVKFNQSGTPLWSRSYGSVTATRVNNIAVSPAGDVFVAGSFSSTMTNFGGGPRNNAGAQGTYDAFVLRLTNAGGYVYDTAFGSTGADHALDVAVNAGLSAFVAGQFQGTVLGMTSANANPDAFLVGLNASGGQTFGNRVGGTLDDAGLAVGLDSLGPVLTGRFRSSVDFGNGTPVVATGNNSGFAVAYTTAGAYRWQKTFLPAAGGGLQASTSVGATGGVVVGGSFSGATDFGSGTPTPVQGGRDIFIIRYDTAGTIIWSNTFAATTATLLGATQADGMLGVVGDFQGTINFGGSNNLVSNGDDDMFFARFAF